MATQSAAPLEAYIAEQVTYWISQDVQSAELTLDGMGASPVEVSISMQGNEAHITFRSDDAATREVLECTALLNPDQTVVVVVMNRSENEVPFDIKIRGMRWAICLPPRAIASYVL